MRRCFLTRPCSLVADSGKPLFRRRGNHRIASILFFGWLGGNRCLFKVWAIVHFPWIIFSIGNENSVCHWSSHHSFFLTFSPHVYCLIFLKVLSVHFVNILIIRARESILRISLCMWWYSLKYFFCFLIINVQIKINCILKAK